MQTNNPLWGGLASAGHWSSVDRWTVWLSLRPCMLFFWTWNACEVNNQNASGDFWLLAILLHIEKACESCSTVNPKSAGIYRNLGTWKHRTLGQFLCSHYCGVFMWTSVWSDPIGTMKQFGFCFVLKALQSDLHTGMMKIQWVSTHLQTMESNLCKMTKLKQC